MTESSGRIDYKAGKLRGHEDLASWHGDIRKALRPKDPEMLGLIPGPLNNGNAAQSSWRKAEAKAKAVIVLNSAPLERFAVASSSVVSMQMNAQPSSAGNSSRLSIQQRTPKQYRMSATNSTSSNTWMGKAGTHT